MELGLKFTRAADEFTSDFQIAKDRAGPVFLSREADAMFVLTAHLKGYKRRNIKIDINEDGTLIGISGERQVKETVMVGWKVYKKDTEIKGFKKVFRIPNGVILDRIKAKFNEDESTLTITMPKKVKGIRGTGIEEVKEKQELVKEGSGNLPIVDEKSLDKDEKLKSKIGEEDEMPIEEKPVLDYSRTEAARQFDDLKDGEKGQPVSPSIHARAESERKEDVENQKKNVDGIEERSERENDEELGEETTDRVPDDEALEDERGKVEGAEEKAQKSFKMCVPIVAGSTLLLSFVVFVIHMVRRKSQNIRRRE